MSDFLAGPWEWNLFLVVNLTAAVVLYGVGVRRLPHRWPLTRSLSFALAIGLLAVVWLGPVAGWSHTFFWAHMTQHLVVMMIVAPLLVLAEPLTLLRDNLSPGTRTRWFDPFMGSRAVRWATDPLVTWILFAAVLLGTHFSPFYEWALGNHDAEVFVERPLFLGVAVLYYLPLIGDNALVRRPTPAVKLLSLGAMMIPEAIVGAVIYFAPVVLYPTFATSSRPFGPDALGDQHLSGAIMWAVVMVIDTMWMMIVAVEWMTAEEERSRELDAASAAGPEPAVQVRSG